MIYYGKIWKEVWLIFIRIFVFTAHSMLFLIIPFFLDSLSMFIFMFCFTILSIVVSLIFIYDILSTYILLEKQGSKLKNILEGDL